VHGRELSRPDHCDARTGQKSAPAGEACAQVAIRAGRARAARLAPERRGAAPAGGLRPWQERWFVPEASGQNSPLRGDVPRANGGNPGMATITLEHVSKRFSDGHDAVKDLSLEIADGEFMILVGPSGCGKSTALNMIAGLEDISEGELRIDGEVVNSVPPKERNIAMVFQNYALYPHMKVRDNMGFALKLAKVPKDEIDRRVREVA
jgi:ABC-type multidrug transport system fused ATPase/permease subunit